MKYWKLAPLSLPGCNPGSTIIWKHWWKELSGRLTVRQQTEGEMSSGTQEGGIKERESLVWCAGMAQISWRRGWGGQVSRYSSRVVWIDCGAGVKELERGRNGWPWLSRTLRSHWQPTEACRNKTLWFWVGEIQIQTEMAVWSFRYFSNALFYCVTLFLDADI